MKKLFIAIVLCVALIVFASSQTRTTQFGRSTAMTGAQIIDSLTGKDIAVKAITTDSIKSASGIIDLGDPGLTQMDSSETKGIAEFLDTFRLIKGADTFLVFINTSAKMLSFVGDGSMGNTYGISLTDWTGGKRLGSRHIYFDDNRYLQIYETGGKYLLNFQGIDIIDVGGSIHGECRAGRFIQDSVYTDSVLNGHIQDTLVDAQFTDAAVIGYVWLEDIGKYSWITTAEDKVFVNVSADPGATISYRWWVIKW